MHSFAIRCLSGPGIHSTFVLSVLSVISLIPLLIDAAAAQSRLKNMPGYDRYVKMRAVIFGSVKRGDPS